MKSLFIPAISGRRARPRRLHATLLGPVVLACGMLLAVNSTALAVPGLPGDFNADGIVSHADYSVLGDGFGTSFTIADFDVYRANYGQTASSPSSLPFSITPTPTVGGNVQWTLAFSNVSGALAGHLALGVDGPGAPDILSIDGGPLFTDAGQGVPGSVPASPPTFSGWLSLSDTDPGPDTNNKPVGVQYNNTTHEAYAALGTTLGQSFSNATVTFLTLVTEGQNTTTLRVFGGASASEFGYQGTDYYFNADQVATFTPVPEPSSAVLTLLALFGLANVAPRRSRR